MVRAAAKNYNDVTVITSNEYYDDLINELKKDKGSTSLEFRKKMSQNAFSEPPTITDVIFPSSFGRDQSPSIVEVRLYDLNGIKNVKLELQKGGSNDLIQISMERNNDNSFQAVIPDSIFKVKNFRARIVTQFNCKP